MLPFCAQLQSVGLTRHLLLAAADRPYMTLEDRNVTYIALDGTDPQLDDHHVRPERILLRIFLTAMHESSRSLTASADPPESQILVRATINRESLDEQPEWGVTGNPRHFYSCVAHRWQPRFFLRQVCGAACCQS